MMTDLRDKTYEDRLRDKTYEDRLRALNLTTLDTKRTTGDLKSRHLK